MLSSYRDSELLRIISELKEIKAMKVTKTKCLSSGLIVGTAATVGGLLLGPRGIAIGGIAAGIAATMANEGQFRSVPDILMNDLTKDQQRRLAKAIRNLLTKKNIMSVSILIMKMTSETGFREFLKAIIKQLLEEFHYQFSN